MKTYLIAIAALALTAGAALAAKEQCVERTVSTNYNDGLNNAVTKVCHTMESNPNDISYEAPEPKACEPKTESKRS